MTTWLIRRFVKDAANVGDPAVRVSYATLGSVTGIIVNAILAAVKFLAGVISGSGAITADAVNNLSDAAASVVAFVTARLSNKPVDPEHPFGHGRMEYLGSLAVGALILCMGVSLLRDGIAAIFDPQPLSISWAVGVVLVLSMAGKWWLSRCYKHLGDAVRNSTLLAASKDSVGDVLSTGAVLISLLIDLFFGLNIDGYVTVLVSLVVLKAGWEVCSDTVDNLLGSKPDPEKIRTLRELLLNREGILGIHDLVLHDYGPGRCYASVHAEVDSTGDILTIHEMIDDAEREIGEKMRMPICIHMDPVVVGDEQTDRLREQMSTFLRNIDPALSLHDFRMVPGDGHTNIIFDCVLPAGYPNRDALLSAMRAFALSLNEGYRLVVQFDTDFT